MAAARSPCRCFKTRILHFKVKNKPFKDKKWKEKVQKNAQLSFCGEREAFHQEIVLRGIQEGREGVKWKLGLALMGKALGTRLLIVDWENGIYSLGLGFSHWEWDEQL